MSEKNSNPKTANDNLVPHHILLCLEGIKKGDYGFWKTLGEVYEEGYGVKPDKQRAVEFYNRFYEEHRSRRVDVDEVELLMKIGHLHLELGNKYRAAEWYLKAGLQIVQDYPKNVHGKMFRKYKVEKFLIQTGYQDKV